MSIVSEETTTNVLAGRTVWIPRMTYIGASMAAAVFRSVGVDASVVPESDERTLMLGSLHTSGEECYPQKITLGDFLRVMDAPDFDPDKTAFFMPTAEGPCRFGQYTPYLRHVLDEMGYQNIPIISPTSKNSYAGFSEHAGDMVRRLWRGVVAGDILRKAMLKTRPYETEVGATDRAMEAGLRGIITAAETPGLDTREHLRTLVEALTKGRDGFHAVPARYTRDRPLIGVVGEIFCRLNTFSNNEAVRQIEAHGGEVWLSDIAEWVWYTNWSHRDRLRRTGKRFSLSMVGAHVRDGFQRRDENALLKPFEEDFVGYEEPHDLDHDMLKPGWPYLPADGALGEMALSIGKSIYLHQKGADGIIDISPFSCMNGIVSEAVYHAVARDYDDIPIRNFYFDDSSSNMDRDLDIFMELAEGYRRRKTTRRRYPKSFEN